MFKPTIFAAEDGNTETVQLVHNEIKKFIDTIMPLVEKSLVEAPATSAMLGSDIARMIAIQGTLARVCDYLVQSGADYDDIIATMRENLFAI